MKLIKLLVTISIINAGFVMAVVNYQSSRQSELLPASSVIPVQQMGSQLETKPFERVSPQPASPSPKLVPSLAPTVKPVANTPTPTPVVTPTPTPTPTPKPQGCLVQIDGVKYEITSLLRSHSGGNIFTCGTDMSGIFWDRHKLRSLQRRQKYKV